MKVASIRISSFHQFKDLNLDLTYPKGHANEGKPLNKVCFIGQSGTGKTSLIELIPKFLCHYNTQFVRKSTVASISNKVTLGIRFGVEGEYSADIFFTQKDEHKGERSTRNWANPQKYGKVFEKSGKDIKHVFNIYKDEWVNKIASKLIYFPANLNFEIDLGTNSISNEAEIIDFSVQKVATVWNLILEQIQAYQEQELQIRQEILKEVQQISDNLIEIKEALNKLEEWKKKEFNPIQDIADNCLNPLLKPFKLKVKTELDVKSKDDIGFIKIEDWDGNEIPNGLWSTGTKQIILSALPLYLLKPKHTVILFDEPERSLYPDMQRLIIDYYSSLTEDCQFFYATHSPIIASNFEPWEIIELKFDKDGHIYRELYYEGENHIDNYTLYPQYMRWDDILQRIFDMSTDGSEKRKEKLDELATSNIAYKKLVTAGKESSDKAKELLTKIQLLTRELSKWD